MSQNDPFGQAEDDIAVSQLFSIFDLRPDGTLVWKSRVDTCKGDRIFNAKFANKAAGSLNAGGYGQVIFRYEGKKYHCYQHRLVNAMRTGSWLDRSIKVDHRNSKRDDNSEENLRPADDAQNAYNSSLRSDNTSGFKGVCFAPHAGMWRSRIHAAKCKIELGYFPTAIDAAKAYDAAALVHHGQFARTNASLGLL